jgi:multicomponent Na+:H+ antiporter subunit G
VGLAPYLADALVMVGVLVMTVGVYGAIRMPDTYTKLHSMSKAVFLGVVSLCVSSIVTGDPATIYRAILIAAFLRGEKMQTPDARVESGRGLAGRTE